jgi:hypothetical protein
MKTFTIKTKTGEEEGRMSKPASALKPLPFRCNHEND